VNGALYRLPGAAVDLLAMRERNYELVDVTDAVVVPDARGRLSEGASVLAFIPRPEALDRLLEARAAGTAVVRLGYAVAVARAFADLAPGELRRFAATTTPHRLPIGDLAVSAPGHGPAREIRGPHGHRDR
jgi:hypothetical protein